MKFSRTFWDIVVVLVFVAILVGGFLYLDATYKAQMASAQIEREVSEQSLNDQIVGLQSCTFELNEKLEKLAISLDIAIEENEMLRGLVEEQQFEIETYKAEIANEEAKWQRRYNEYPQATEAWIAMKTLGWSDETCAGIMGNLMVETGGYTLNLDWDSNGSSGYGLVQWIGSRRDSIKAKYGVYPTIKEQVQFIYDELYGTDGVPVQVSDSQRDAIIYAETPEDAAYAFASYYERCASEYRAMRKEYAREAYSYFVD